MNQPVTLAEAAVPVREHWAAQYAAGLIRSSTAQLYERHLDTFIRFAAAHDIATVEQVTAALVARWIAAPVSAVSPGSRGRAGQRAAASTQRSRQGPLRTAVTMWVDLGWVDASVVPSRQIPKNAPLPPCPLTPAEVVELRRAGVHSRVDSLLPVLVELALAGLTQAEIAALPVAAVDGEAGIVLIDGGPDTGGRNAVLLPAARDKVVRHVAALERLYGRTGDVFDPATVPLGLHPVPRSVRDRVRPTVVGQHLYRALKLAGITRTGVTPGSMRVYAANAVYACTNRVEDVASALGIASLDVAFRLIEPMWQASWAQHVREQEA